GAPVNLKDRLARLRVWRPCRGGIAPGRAAAGGAGPPRRSFSFGQGSAPYARAGATLARLPGTPASPGATPGRKPLLPDAEGRIRVRVSDPTPSRLPRGGG